MDLHQEILSSPNRRHMPFREGGPGRRAHLIGAAGSGLRSLARMLLQRGWQVTGSDTSQAAEALGERLGIAIHDRHDADNVPDDVDAVVYSDAIDRDNPELTRALEAQTPVLSYFQFLGQLMWGKHGIAIAGTHGKTTTSAMVTEILVTAGRDPTAVFGAETLGGMPGGRTGEGEYLLVEACEHRANFLNLRPKHAVILPVEWDHFESYRTRDELDHAFALFASSIDREGLLLAADDAAMERIAAGARCPVETFGFGRGAVWSAARLRHRRGFYSFELCYRGRPGIDIQLRVPGRHNVLNALAASALALRLGVGWDTVAGTLAGFHGVRRRLEVLGCWGGITLVDDYAHHPTEVRAALTAVRQMYPGRRIWVVFQPHQALRTTHLLDELAQSLHNAEIVLVTDIFRAREPEFVAGEATAADLAARLRSIGQRVPPVHGTRAIEMCLIAEARPGDVILTLGAGDIRKICDGFIHRLRGNHAAG